MKKTIAICMVAILSTGIAVAQGTEKRQADKSRTAPAERVEKPRTSVETPTTQRTESQNNDTIKARAAREKARKDKQKPDGKGNAYGKDKKGMEGKEFGQHRAAEAKSKKESDEVTEANLSRAEKSNAATREKIKQARASLDQKKKEKKISKDAYDKKQKEIDTMEKELIELEKRAKMAREQLDQQRGAGKK